MNSTKSLLAVIEGMSEGDKKKTSKNNLMKFRQTHIANLNKIANMFGSISKDISSTKYIGEEGKFTEELYLNMHQFISCVERLSKMK